MAGRGGWIASAFEWLGNRPEEIAVGSRYRLVLPDGSAETAVVAGLFSDAFGIPHVRFNLQLDRPCLGRYAADGRVLGLKAFRARFLRRGCHRDDGSETIGRAGPGDRASAASI